MEKKCYKIACFVLRCHYLQDLSKDTNVYFVYFLITYVFTHRMMAFQLFYFIAQNEPKRVDCFFFNLFVKVM